MKVTPGISPDNGRDIADINAIRSRIADTSILVIAAICLPFMGFSLYRYYIIGWHYIFALQGFIALLFIIAAPLRKRLPYALRVSLLTVSPFLLGVAALTTFGLLGLGIGFFLSVAVFATAFFSPRSGIALTVACGLSVLAVGALFRSGHLALSFDITAYANAPSSWLNAAFGISFLSVGLTLVIGALHSSISGLFAKINSRNIELEESNRSLEEEITHRAEVQTELAKTRSYLDSVIHSMPSMLIGIDNEGAIISFNKAAEARAEASSSASRGRKIAQVFPFLAGQIEGVIAAARKGEILEKRRVEQTVGGAIRLVNISGYPLKDSVAVRGAVIRIDDVTDIEKMEGHIRQAQKMETVANLAGGIAHDLNNMLGGILASASLLQRITAKENISRIDEVRRYEELIRDSCLQAASLTKQLMGLSRKQETTLVPLDLNQSVDQVLKLCRTSFPASVDIRATPRGGPATVLADQSQLQQVILNLCINASHAVTVMRGGGESQGGAIIIEIDSIRADEHVCATHTDAARGTDYFILRISDNGVGMSPETVSRVFDPFFTTKKEGTGLGLSVAYSIIKSFGGFIDVYSYPRRGTTVNVYLPEQRPGTGGLRPAHAPDAIVAGSGRVAVIDDDAVIRNIAAGILAECGYDVSAAAGGAEGIELITREPGAYSGILLDMSMPGMSGLEVIERIRAVSPGMPVLLSSGLRLDEGILKKLEDIGIPFIQKPYNAGTLSAKMKAIIGRGSN